MSTTTVLNKIALACLMLSSVILIQCEKDVDTIEPGSTIIDPSRENEDNREVGVFSGSYNLQGTFSVDGTGIHVNDDYQGTTAPGPVWYLSNSSESIQGGVRIGSANKSSGRHTIGTTQALDYEYLILWCDPFSVFIGNGKLKD